jgi:hypothetical protein
MITDAQVRLLRKKLMEGQTQEAAAAAADMSESTARRWKDKPLPSQTKMPRPWRTRLDPLEAVWPSEVVPLLEADKDRVLEATTLIDLLAERHPGVYGPQHCRTLQRRIRDWRALHGPEREVYFEQRHVAGREGCLDFTNCNELQVTVQGQMFLHLLFQFVLSFSGWTWVGLAYTETFEALLAGLQGALWALKGAPSVVRSDNLSAATHQLAKGGPRGLTARFKAVLDHYGLKSTRINAGESHENGCVEKRHDILKSHIGQALLIRGSRDFDSVEQYMAFVRVLVDKKRNAFAAAKLDEERAHLRALPAAPLPDYTTYKATVRLWSTIRVNERTYSVPSRLKGHEVEARQFADTVEVHYRGRLVETMPRIRQGNGHRIDYRHIIWSLVRKPGAFARYKYREELFPSLVFRRAYDALTASHGERSDVEYVRILHLAASQSESLVERVLGQMLERDETIDFARVKALAVPEKPAIPHLEERRVDFASFDALLGDTTRAQLAALGGGR